MLLSNPKDIPIEIDNYVKSVGNKMEPLQKSLFNRVSAQLKELDVDSDGLIRRTSKNIDIITNVKTELNAVLNNPKYKSVVNSVNGMLDEVNDLQGSYFQTINPSIAPPPIIDDMSKLAFDSAKTDLTKAGFQQTVVNSASDIVQTSIMEGTSYADMNTQLKEFIVGNKETNGKLVSYTKQILSDTLHGASRNYNSIMTEKLGLTWYRYVGAEVDSTRPWCHALLKKEWIHESELGAIASGKINGVQVSRAGMMPDTNKENVISRCGGYNCPHHMVPVSADVVPVKLRNKFEKKTN